MRSRAIRAIDGINSAKWAWVEPKFWFKCSERNEPRASADNSGTVIKEDPPRPAPAIVTASAAFCNIDCAVRPLTHTVALRYQQYYYRLIPRDNYRSAQNAGRRALALDPADPNSPGNLGNALVDSIAEPFLASFDAAMPARNSWSDQKIPRCWRRSTPSPLSAEAVDTTATRPLLRMT